MPMLFPDFQSLIDSQKTVNEDVRFRAPLQGETEAEYRVALADHWEPIDLVQSLEYRCGGKEADMQKAIMEHLRKASSA